MTDDHRQVLTAAHRLAIAFSEESDIPARFRARAEKSAPQPRRRGRTDTSLEARFSEDVGQWKRLTETMLAKVSTPLAWRFINCSPSVEEPPESVSECQDFCGFVDYLILRRDTDECDAAELGRLCRLMGSFQREVQKRVRPREARAVEQESP